MGIFSKQNWYCCACGAKINRSCSGPYTKPMVCDRDCMSEYEWRKTLSIMGKEFYPQVEVKK